MGDMDSCAQALRFHGGMEPKRAADDKDQLLFTPWTKWISTGPVPHWTAAAPQCKGRSGWQRGEPCKDLLGLPRQGCGDLRLGGVFRQPFFWEFYHFQLTVAGEALGILRYSLL